MANSEDKKLAIDVIARVDKLEKAMAKASAATRTQTGRMEKSVASMRTRMDKDFTAIGSAVATRLVAPLLALGAAGIIRSVGDIARGMAEIGDEAKRAGVGVESFQELKYVAEQSRIGVDALTDGLKELNLRADEFIVTGKGSSAEAFQRLGYTAESLAEKLKDPSALFTEIIGKLGKFETAAQVRIADEVFGGTGGEKFVQLIAQGEDGIRSLIDEGRDLGAVMDEEMIAKAAQLDAKFNAISTTVGNALKGAIVEAGSALSDFLNLFEETSRKSTDNLEALLKAEQETRARWGTPGTDAFNASLQREEEIMAELRKRAKAQLRTELISMGGSGGTTPTVPGSGAGQSAEEKKALAEAAAVLKLIDALKYEQSTIGMNARELAIANALRDAGSAATAEQRAQIESLVGANFDLQASQEQLTSTLTQLGETGKDVLRGMIDDMLAGKDAADILSNALSNIGNRLLDTGLGAAIGGPFRMELAA